MNFLSKEDPLSILYLSPPMAIRLIILIIKIRLDSVFFVIQCLSDGELSHHMNTRVPSEPRYELRKINHSQKQHNTILLLIHKFEKLSIHYMNEEGIFKTLKESVDPKGIIFPSPSIIY